MDRREISTPARGLDWIRTVPAGAGLMADAASKTQGQAPAKTIAPVTDPSLPDLTGRTLGDYQILRRLGVGGMGQVYLARQLSLKREVALKLLRDELNKNPTALMRFQAEAEAVAKLNHPNIVHIHQMGEVEGLRFMALEYVEGRNLRDHLARKGPPDLPITLSIIRQVVLAIQQAHEYGIVHRDIKPENILITRKVEVKVTDFGLSRYFAGETPALNLTQSGITLGTPLYMSPEQVQGHAVDHRSDIYSLGVTCYHLLAGEPPFRGATAFDVALKHVQDQPQPLGELCPDLPADLCGMIHKMMAKNPNDRYASAREILRDLAKVRDGLSLSGGGPNTGARLQIPGIALSGPIPTPAAATHHNGLQNTEGLPLQTPPRKWGKWAIGLGVCLLATTGGVLLSATKSQPQPDPPPTPTWTSSVSTTGLSDIRPSEKMVTVRERELIALITPRSSEPEVNQAILQGSIELGLLYVRERRLDEAADRFKKLEKEPLPGVRTFSMAGRLGQAVVLAYRDTKPNATASIDLVTKVVNEPYPNAKQKVEKTYQEVAKFLAKHPDLCQGVADALNRNMVTLSLTKLEPLTLELLRAPPRLGLKQ
ncbi:MAG TPA: serine/threonine-protein kinase [Gemmata sp.]|jgi:serine/threonine-protein kinase|nr:serine/threonine-protein kinase [Gemmata sp.]